MAKRRRARARKSEARENGPELLWILLGLGVVGAGATIYFVTRPAAAAPAAAPIAPGTISAAQIQAALNNFNNQVNSQIAQPADTSGGADNSTTTSNLVNTGIPGVDDTVNGAASSAGDTVNGAVNSAASQLGF
jgi:hypothetical protein